MTALALRAAMLAAVLVAAALAVRSWERRRGPRRAVLPPGLTVVTGPGCRLCGPVLAALRRAGAEPLIVDVSSTPVAVASLPTALVVGERGRVILRRAGRSALDDAPLLAHESRGAVGRFRRR